MAANSWNNIATWGSTWSLRPNWRRKLAPGPDGNRWSSCSCASACRDPPAVSRIHSFHGGVSAAIGRNGDPR
jgi:hypothetical protein